MKNTYKYFLPGHGETSADAREIKVTGDINTIACFAGRHAAIHVKNAYVRSGKERITLIFVGNNQATFDVRFCRDMSFFSERMG